MSRKILLVVAVLFSCSMLYYIQRILVPYQLRESAASGRPRGNLSDLYPRWLGSRELLVHHRDPYSPEVTRQIQLGYYGRPLDPQRATDPKDQEAFAYPVYVAFLLWPFIYADFSIIMPLFSWLLVLLTLASVLLWHRALRLRLPALVIVSTLLLTLGSFQVLQGVKLQQLSLLVGGLVAACVAALAGGHLALAGFLMALATIKPQLAVPMFCWLALWALSDLHRRRRFLFSFFLTLAVLAGGGEWLLPGWVSRFRTAIYAYMQYTGGRSLLQQMTTHAIGSALTVVLILFTAAVCWRARRAEPGSRVFSWTLALVLASTVSIVPMLAPYNHVLLLPAILMAYSEFSALWQRGLIFRAAIALVVVAIAWPWLATLSLFVAHFFVPVAKLESAWTLPLYSMLTIPLAVLALLLQPSWRGGFDRPGNPSAKPRPTAASHTPA